MTQLESDLGTEALEDWDGEPCIDAVSVGLSVEA